MVILMTILTTLAISFVVTCWLGVRLAMLSSHYPVVEEYVVIRAEDAQEADAVLERAIAYGEAPTGQQVELFE